MALKQQTEKKELAPKGAIPKLGPVGVVAVLVLWNFTPAKDVVVGMLVMNMPVTKDIEMGRAYVSSQHLEQRIVRHSAVAAVVRDVTTALTQCFPDDHFQWEFHVIQDPSVNAFALPGGLVFINSGLLLAAQSPAELAGVLAHELSHVAHRHGVRKVVEADTIQTIIGAVVHDDNDGHDETYGEKLSEVIAKSAAKFGSLAFSRDQERDADETGWKCLLDIKRDPLGMISFFQKLAKLGGENVAEPRDSLSNMIGTMTSTHPGTGQRIHALQKQWEELPTNKKRNLRSWDDSQWKTMQQTLRQLTAKQH